MQAVASEVMVPLSGGTNSQAVQPAVVNQAGSCKAGVFQNTLKAKMADSKDVPETEESAVNDTGSDNVNAVPAYGLSALPGALTLVPVTNAETDQLTAVSNVIAEPVTDSNQQAIAVVTTEDSTTGLPFADLMANQNTDSQPVSVLPVTPNMVADEQLIAANLPISNPVIDSLKMADTLVNSQPPAESAGDLSQMPASNQFAVTIPVTGIDNSQGNMQVVSEAPENAITMTVDPNAVMPVNNTDTEPGKMVTAQAFEQIVTLDGKTAAKVDPEIVSQTAVISVPIKQEKNQTENQTNSTEIPVSTKTGQDSTQVDKQAAVKSQTNINSQAETTPAVLPAETSINQEKTLTTNNSESSQSTSQSLELNGTDEQSVSGANSDASDGSRSKTDTASDLAMLFKLQQSAQNRIMTKQTAANPQENVKNVIQRLELMLKDNLAQAKMVLKPEHMGQLTVRMDVQDGVLNAKFIVDNQQAKAMLESNLTVFRQQLEQSGVRVEKVEVTINQPGNDGSQFFNQSQYRPPGQGSYQQSGFSYYSRQDNYGSDNYDYLPEKVPLIPASSNSLGADGVNYVI